MRISELDDIEKEVLLGGTMTTMKGTRATSEEIREMLDDHQRELRAEAAIAAKRDTTAQLDSVEKEVLLGTVIEHARADLNDGRPLTEMRAENEDKGDEDDQR